ncbi:FERM domain-containing protein 5-like [Dysidea avara]|uniref:FERM domain-containing protein 5-like n=1 Tax=Dysidea avara TaxID=196820 RepID=UPI00331ABE82
MFRRRGERRSNSIRAIEVECLDSSHFEFALERRLTGDGLLGSVCHSLGLREVGFFGLIYKRPEDEQEIWLDVNKLVRKQLTGVPPYLLHLGIKVYPVNSLAVDEATRNYLYLQVRSDIQSGRLRCENMATFSQLIAFLAQVELGDYHPSASLSQLKLPNMNTQLLGQVSDTYSQLSGKTLSTCKEELLSLAQKEETYGMVTYQVQDAARRPANLGLCPHGIRVMYGTIPTSIHQWESVTKISTKHKTVNLKICNPHTHNFQKAKFHCPHLHDTKLLAKTIAEMVGYYREQGRISETLPRFRRLFGGRSSRRIQRSASLRIPTRSSQGATSGVRSFATQSFSARDIMFKPNSNNENTSFNLITKRSLSVSANSTPALNGRLLHETGQRITEPYCDLLKGDQKHASSSPDQESSQELHSKNFSSFDRLTDKMETSCEVSFEQKKPLPSPLLDTQTSALEVSLVETIEGRSYLGSLEIHPRNSTPQQVTPVVNSQSDLSQHNGSPPLVTRNGTPPQGTPLQAIPERMKQQHNPLVNGSPSFKSKSSPMLRGTRFCSESSIQRTLRTQAQSPERSPSVIYRNKRGRGSVTSEITNSLLYNRPSSILMPEVQCDESYLDSHIRSILFDTSQREETSTEF